MAHKIKGVVVRTIKRGDKFVPAQIVKCAYCSHVLPFVNSKGTGALPEAAIRTKSIAQGWQFSKKGKHVCPECLFIFKASKRYKPEKTAMAQSEPSEAVEKEVRPAATEEKPMPHKVDHIRDGEGNVVQKRCSKCKQMLPLESFSRHHKGAFHRHSMCRVCDKKRNDEYRARVARDREKQIQGEKENARMALANGQEKPQQNTAATPSTAPRQMTIAQRRNIWREIDANYRDDGAGYIGTVTDHSIAEKLKVPRAWVSNIREQDFGPEGSNEALQEIGRELSKIAKLVVEVTDDAMNAAARAETLSGTIKDVERRLREVERAVGPHRNFTNRGING